MDQKVARIVVPLAATFAVAAGATGAWAAGGATARWPSAAGTTACPADAAPSVSAMPGASPSGAVVNPASLRLALTAHGVRTPDGDAIEYRVSARPARAPLHDITVTVRLTCVPGTVWVAGTPWASTGRAALGRRAVTWRLDLAKAPATAGFAVRLRPDSRGGPLVGEVVAAGPVSNCPALRATDTPVDPHCRVTILIPGEPARPAVRPTAVQGASPIVQDAPPAFPHVPSLPLLPPVPPAGAAMGNGGTAPGAPLVAPAPAPSPTVLSQLDRAPIVPADPAGDLAAREALRSGGTSARDLGGRAFALLIGGVALLLTVTAIAAGVIGARPRRRDGEGPGPGRPVAPPRYDGRPRTTVEVVRRAAASRDTHAIPGADPAGGRDRSPGRTTVDE
ncbi:hypothetical protein FB559_6080 [Actinoallomurus bryophytorum]|uniref:Uncharacterized protein n=1 Tax=Actinoallomurus bryophytorum TaxID=1490222 RepID=A0A543CTX3_9ACTN|nr:hypothetical protein [Actinoallomurus bryophytorum]TQM00368.1 hypothetical protein FB559_6080 [Actinoallomurus bryophytorum]